MLTDATTGSSLWGKAHYADAYAQNLTQALFPGLMLAFQLSQRTAQLQSVFNQGTGTSTAVSFDAAGNESAIGSASYTYSPRNLLASGDGIAYAYDGYGQRVSATTTISGSSATETSLYDPGRHLQMQTGLSSGSTAYDYIWFGNTPVAEEGIAGSNTYWTAVDHLGAPIILTNGSGAIAWQADYEPFGDIYQVRTGSSIHQPLRFPGQEAELFDGSAGINGFSARLYNGMRWYRPQWGRYTQADPLSYIGSTYNLYGYVGNDPVNEIDSSGLYGFGVIGSASGEAGIVAGAGVTGSVGSGVFGGGSQGIGVGSFASFGAFAGALGYGVGYPTVQPGGTTGVIGAYGGVGAGGFLTNATAVGQLSGQFNTYSINTLYGSVQLGVSGNIWILSGTYGPGALGAASAYPTNTWTIDPKYGRC